MTDKGTQPGAEVATAPQATTGAKPPLIRGSTATLLTVFMYLAAIVTLAAIGHPEIAEKMIPALRMGLAGVP